MKKTSKYIIIISVIFSSCSDFLNRDPFDSFGEDQVWGDLPLMESFVNNIYYNVHHNFWGKIGMQIVSDEACRSNARGGDQITLSNAEPGNLYCFRSERGLAALTWQRQYEKIRACNLFLEQSSERTYPDEDWARRLTGEVYFLRAWTYHQLAFFYGGVPVSDKPYILTDDGQEPRNSFEEVINFVIADCDRAANLLPLEHTTANDGRATKGAALALKARTLLYAASDLYHSPAWATGYSNPELIAYTTRDAASRNARWLAAKNAAQVVMDMPQYDLYKPDPELGEDIAANFGEMFILKKTCEDIFVRQFTKMVTEGPEIYHPGLHTMPGGYHCHGSNNPIGQAVDDFEMSDGSKFSWDNPAHKAAPYENREPRFYASILYDGAQWRERPEDVQVLDPLGIIQTGWFYDAAGNSIAGLDTRSSVIEPQNCTMSGYYQKKQIDPSYNHMYEVQESPWRHLRYTEILLSYAEACNELGEDAEAERIINLIRKRAGLPGISGTGDDLRQLIRHERRIELMFEGQRYLDIRRWMIASQVLATHAHGIRIDHWYGQPTEYKPILDMLERRWLDRAYFFPILQEEMNRNLLLVQNPLH